MLTDIQTVTAAYLSDAEANITLVSSRPAQACIRIVEPLPLPAGPTIRSLFVSPDTEALDSGLSLNVTPSAADATIAQLLRFEQLGEDWDGNDAAKPLSVSLREARNFIRLLSPDSVIPRPALHADGHAILFVREHDVYAEFEFLEDRKIGFYSRRGNQKWSGEFTFDGMSLPDGLSQIGLLL